MWKGRGNIVVYALLAILAVISLLILFRLRERFENSLSDRIDDLQRVFSSRTLLKMPSDHKIVFADIEAEAAKYENRGEFGSLWISKNFGQSQRIIYPFYYPPVHSADIEVAQKDNSVEIVEQGYLERLLLKESLAERPLISDDGERLGTLFVQVNEAPLRTVSMVIWALGAMLATSLAFLASQFRRQEKVISATTIELEEKRRELVRLERLAMAGQLSANILHDLKKPVLNIRNEADEALHPMETNVEPPAPSGIFSRIREQADFFLAILKDAGFDRFVRAQEEREYVDINELLDRSLALVRYEQANITVNRSYEPELPPVLAAPVRIIQVFSNVILNAYQAMGGRGDLCVETKQTGDSILVDIVDNGPGMSEKLITNIFDPFYTTKPPGQGTGLGLYIVADILRDLGGTISVTSKPGHTTFHIKFRTET